jgi:predicted RNA-binding Zn-ribbon protein involved in translation (DUF1610 family)
MTPEQRQKEREADQPRRIAELTSALAEMTARAEAYKRAKEENDERFMLERDSALSRLKAAEDGRWWKCPSCTEQTEMRDILNELRCPCCGFAAPALAASREEAVRAFAEFLDERINIDEAHDEWTCFQKGADVFLASLAGKEHDKG